MDCRTFLSELWWGVRKDQAQFCSLHACSRLYETSIIYCHDQSQDLQTKGHCTIPWSRKRCYMPSDLYTMTLVRSVQRSTRIQAQFCTLCLLYTLWNINKLLPGSNPGLSNMRSLHYHLIQEEILYAKGFIYNDFGEDCAEIYADSSSILHIVLALHFMKHQ